MSKVIHQMQQVEEFPSGWRGCKGTDIFEGSDLARQAWGDNCEVSGAAALAYLWRRFGPPWIGCDNHKSIADYHLTTENPRVLLWITVTPSPLEWCVGAMWSIDLDREIRRPQDEWNEKFQEWWLKERHPELEALEDTEDNRKIASELYWSEILGEQAGEINKAAELKIGPMPPRPSCIDWQSQSGPVHDLNNAIFNALKELERPVYVRDYTINVFGPCEGSDEPADRSRYAGFGVPKSAMDQVAIGN